MHDNRIVLFFSFYVFYGHDSTRQSDDPERSRVAYTVPE